MIPYSGSRIFSTANQAGRIYVGSKWEIAAGNLALGMLSPDSQG